MRLLPVFIFSMFCFQSFAQINPHKLDSLSRSIDSTAKAYRNWQDSFGKVQDSIYQAAVDTPDSTGIKNGLEQQRKEAQRRKEALIRIGIGVFLFLMFVILLMRKRKQQV